MCGIVGYIGNKKAAPILLDGLSKLEYRGYDSAGIAVSDGSNITVKKAKGRLKILCELTKDGQGISGNIGIGHTRWATHGAPTDINAHPHANHDNTVVVVHNGIINNYAKIKESLVKKGYDFKSETDTEVIANLFSEYKDEDPIKAISYVLNKLDGSYALGIIFKNIPDRIFAARKNSPLIVAKNEEGSFIASDVPAILKYTRDVYYVDNDEIVELKAGNIIFYNEDREKIDKEKIYIDWDAASAQKDGYEHFMLKEIYEQPKAIKDTLFPRIKNGLIDLSEISLNENDIKKLKEIIIVACGSSYHVGRNAQYIIEEMTRIPVRVELASEFRYRGPIIKDDSLVIFISQSGETADTLEALRLIKDDPCKKLAIVNVIGSSLARECEDVLYTYTGPEIAVATTKAYSAQLIVIYLLSIYIASVLKKIDKKEEETLIRDLIILPKQIESLLENKKRIQKLANRYVAAKNVFFIGRGIDYAISLEGSLKLKEISYINSEGYAAGELKHGTISLIENNTLVTAILTQEELFSKMLANIEEVKSRGAYVMAVTTEGHIEVENVCDFIIYIPRTSKYFTSSLTIIPLQLFSYYISIGKGNDPDHPRNLAKSVTVE